MSMANTFSRYIVTTKCDIIPNNMYEKKCFKLNIFDFFHNSKNIPKCANKNNCSLTKV